MSTRWRSSFPTKATGGNPLDCVLGTAGRLRCWTALVSQAESLSLRQAEKQDLLKGALPVLLNVRTCSGAQGSASSPNLTAIFF